jgi:tRNA A-37 threonylcarbamoyl transferase component Bud32
MKRPRARNWWRALVQLWPPSRSLRGWRIGHALLHRDVPTARPLAVLEQRWGPLVRDSVLVTEALPDASDLEQYLRRTHARLGPRGWARCKRELARELAAHVRRLQENGFEHRDCKASNILVRDTEPRRLTWIDLDGLRLRRGWSRRASWRPLIRLHVSLLALPGLTRTDRVRFLREYLVGYGAPADAWRRLWPTLTRASQKKSRAKAVRRAWKLKHYGRE